MKIRKHTCFMCDHTWESAVRQSKDSQNLSGEPTEYCPKCNKRAQYSSAIFEIETFEEMFPNAVVFHVDAGDYVICDLCGKDWTNDETSGGFYGCLTKAICPDCAPEMIEACKKYGELHHIKAYCPRDKSFANWVREDLR